MPYRYDLRLLPWRCGAIYSHCDSTVSKVFWLGPVASACHVPFTYRDPAHLPWPCQSIRETQAKWLIVGKPPLVRHPSAADDDTTHTLMERDYTSGHQLQAVPLHSSAVSGCKTRRPSCAAEMFKGLVNRKEGCNRHRFATSDIPGRCTLPREGLSPDVGTGYQVFATPRLFDWQQEAQRTVGARF